MDEPTDVNPRVRTHRPSSELARMVREGRRLAEALQALSDRAPDPEPDDLDLAAELARALVRRCDTRHAGWQVLRDALQEAGAEIPWSRAERQAYGPVAELMLIDCATPGRTPLIRVQHTAAQQRARALAAHVDPDITARLGARDVRVAPADWPDTLAAAVRARTRAGLVEALRSAAAHAPSEQP